jgi:lipid-binding SYLF domain-containing protein
MRTVRMPLGLTLALVTMLLPAARPALAATAAEIDREVTAALSRLYQVHPEAKALSKDARGILVFPSIVKAGFMFGAQYGEGAMRSPQGKKMGYYNTVAASYGFQAGAQKFGYALFFMKDSAIKYLEESGGFELGSGPSIVVVDTGTAKSLSTSTARSDIYAMFFDQKGLMGGLGLQGTKISRIQK